MDVLSILLEMNVYAAVIFCAITLFKKLLKGKASPALHYGIWFVLVLRLVLPVTIQSDVRMITIPEPLQVVQSQAENTQAETLETSPPAANANVAPEVPAAPEQNSTAPFVTGHKNAILPEIDYRDALVYVWLAGIAAFAAYAIVNAIRLHNSVRHRSVLPDARLHHMLDNCRREAGVRGNVRLRVARGTNSPALMFPNTILMPLGLIDTMSQRQLELSMIHELTHFKRGDHVVQLLMLALRTIHWFNPVVWLACKFMRDDIETACDSAVVRGLDSDEKRYYAGTVLSMFAGSSQMVLNMAGKTRKLAEQRIRGIYMKNKSKLSTKILAVCMSMAVGACCFTTALKPVLTEGEEAGAAAPSSPVEAVNWTETVNFGDNGVINVDVDVALPDSNSFPVYEVTPVELTQEKADALINYFSPGSVFYRAELLPKSHYLEQLESARKGDFIDGEYVLTEGSEARVKELEETIANMPETPEVQPAGTGFGYYTDQSNGNVDEAGGENYIQLSFEEDGHHASIWAVRSGEFNYNSGLNVTTQSLMAIQPFPTGDERQYYDEMTLRAQDSLKEMLDSGFFESFKTTEQQAISQANEVLAELGISDMALAKTEKAALERYEGMVGFTPSAGYEQGYELTYVKQPGELAGMLEQSSWSGSASEYNEEYPVYKPTSPMETISIVVSDNGVESFYWMNMAQAVERPGGESEMIPFDVVKQRILEQAGFSNVWVDSDSVEVKIGPLELRSAYINDKDNPGGILMVPVWQAKATIQLQFDGESHTQEANDIVINALDGGVVEHS